MILGHALAKIKLHKSDDADMASKILLPLLVLAVALSVVLGAFDML
jgi:hypothetical protein